MDAQQRGPLLAIPAYAWPAMTDAFVRQFHANYEADTIDEREVCLCRNVLSVFIFSLLSQVNQNHQSPAIFRKKTAFELTTIGSLTMNNDCRRDPRAGPSVTLIQNLCDGATVENEMKSESWRFLGAYALLAAFHRIAHNGLGWLIRGQCIRYLHPHARPFHFHWARQSHPGQRCHSTNH